MSRNIKSLRLEQLDTGYTSTAITEEYGREKQINKAFSTLQELLKYIEENF